MQAWAYSEANYGWAFIPTGPNGWTWASSENANSDHRPALLVDYFVERSCTIVSQPQSVTVAAGNPAALTVVARGNYLHYQWYKFRTGPRIADPILGATNSTYQISRSRTPDSGDYYVVVRSFDDTATCTSQVARLTVLCDDSPVQVVSAIGNPDQSTITLLFNRSVDPALAQNTPNYVISGGPTVTSASINSNQVTLTTNPPREAGLNYTLTVWNLVDDLFCGNRISPNPTVINLTQDVRLISFNAVWLYQNDGLDLGTNWAHPHYDDSTWAQGPGLLGFETTAATLTALSNQNAFVNTRLSLTTQSGQPIMTDYFRTLLNISFDTAGVVFTIRHVVDDGAVFYFNGMEAARFNMPDGPIDSQTPALSGPLEGVVRSITNVMGLVCGLNSIAVEVHNQAPTSGDILFGAEIIARVPMFIAADCFPFIRAVLDEDQRGILYWSGPILMLQEAETLGGEWRDIPEATSPWSVTPGGGTRFYRLRGP